MEPAYVLPALYAPWMAQLLGGAIPQETAATCDDCAMCRPAGQTDDQPYLDPGVKCCSYQPQIANFLVGRILSDRSGSAEGRASVASRLGRRVGVSPLGMDTPASFEVLYLQAPHAFGRAPALLCPHYVSNGHGGCGIWANRPAVCATYFCKVNRGAVGLAFWQRLKRLLEAIDVNLSLWCVAELNVGSPALAELVALKRRLDLDELGGATDMTRYHRLWGKWRGREAEYFEACAGLVSPLDWDRVVAICGPRVRVLSEVVREDYARILSDAVPRTLGLNRLRIQAAGEGKLRVVAYSESDPLLMSEALASALPIFRGQPTEEALDTIQSRLGLSMTPGLVRRLVDFGILAEPDEGDLH